MVPWVECPTLDIDLDLPLKRRYQDAPAEAIEKGKRLLREIAGNLPPQAKLLAYGVRLRTANRFHKETCAIAERVGADWQTVLLANVTYDLAVSLFGCSTIALPTPEGPVLARNMDWFPEDLLAQTSYLIRAVRKSELVYAIAGWPGALGVVTGLSARGFAIALNAILNTDGIDWGGYPVLLHIRRVLEDARDFTEAVKMLAETRLAAGCLFTVVGKQNHERVVIERSSKKHVERWAVKGEPLVATNDYRKLSKPRTSDVAEIYQTTCARYDALCRFYADHTPERAVEDASLLYILTDPSVIQGITAQHIILRPRLGQIRMCVPRRLLR